jgi:hypothetical protein
MESCNAVDGDMGTRWTSEKYVLPQWLELTWNEPQKLTGVRIAFENAYATEYAVQTWDGISWINQTSVAGNSKLEVTHDFADTVETTKLRICVTGFSTFDRVSIWELETYSADVASTSSTLCIPRAGEYMLAARVATSPNHGTLYFTINDVVYSISCSDSTSHFGWREIGPFRLNAGNVTIGVGGAGLVELDELLIYSLKEGENYLSSNDLFSCSSPNVSITYEKVNPCTFKAYVNASEPFTLVFSETYDPLWKAFTDGESYSSTPTYSLINSFHINRTGQFTVTLYFTGQTNANLGLIIAFATFVASIVALPLMSSNRANVLKQKIIRLRKSK